MDIPERMRLMRIYEPYEIMETVRDSEGVIMGFKKYLRDDAPEEAKEAFKKHMDFVNSDEYELIR